MEWSILLGILLGAVAFGLLYLIAAPGGAPRKLKRAFAPTTLVTEENQMLELVGEAKFQPTLAQIFSSKANVSTSIKSQAVLIADPHLAGEGQAIKAEINGKTVGHLDVQDAKAFRKYLARKNVRSINVAALVHRGTSVQTNQVVFTVSIEVPEDWLD